MRFVDTAAQTEKSKSATIGLFIARVDRPVDGQQLVWRIHEPSSNINVNISRSTHCMLMDHSLPCRYFGKLALAFEYEASLPHAVPLFAMDCSDNNASKRFVVGGYKSIYTLVERCTRHGKAHFYELLRADTPLRLFLDVDVRTSDRTAAEFERDMETIRSGVQQCLRYATDDASLESKSKLEPTSISLDASTPSKHSRHLVFPNVFFANMAALRSFMLHRVREEPHLRESGIDFSVYTPNRLFRVLGSSKRSSSSSVPLSCGRPFNVADWFRTLVSAYHVGQRSTDEVLRHLPTLETPPRLLGAPPTAFKSKFEGTKRRRLLASPNRTNLELGGFQPSATTPKPTSEGTVVLDPSEWDEIVNRVSNFIQRTHPSTERIYSHRIGDRLRLTLAPGLPCPNNGNVRHRSNCSYFFLHLKTARTFYKCADPQCGGHTWDYRCRKALLKNAWV